MLFIGYCCLEFISHHIKEILHVNPNSKKKKRDIHFHLFVILILKNNAFFNVEIKPLSTTFYFSQFHDHIFRNSRSQMFFKIGALKNFAIFRKLQHRYFSCEYCEIFKNSFSIEHLRWLLLYFLKVIKYDVLILFSSIKSRTCLFIGLSSIARFSK